MNDDDALRPKTCSLRARYHEYIIIFILAIIIAVVANMSCKRPSSRPIPVHGLDVHTYQPPMASRCPQVIDHSRQPR
jgi:hypothetical protein